MEKYILIWENIAGEIVSKAFSDGENAKEHFAVISRTCSKVHFSEWTQIQDGLWKCDLFSNSMISYDFEEEGWFIQPLENGRFLSGIVDLYYKFSDCVKVLCGYPE
ncbi:MAG: hypothetical protein WA061_02120 [Microgenomates group bacterium]